MTRLSRAAATISFVTAVKSLTFKMRSTWVSSRESKRKFPALNPNEAGDDLWREHFVGQRDTSRYPALLKELGDLHFVERPKLMNESDPGVELWESSDPLLDARHADEHHTNPSFIEDRAHGLETVHLKSISLIDQNECRRIRYCSFHGLEMLERLEVSRIGCRWVTRRASGFVQDFSATRFVTQPNGLQSLSGLLADRAESHFHQLFTCSTHVRFDPRGSIDNCRSTKHGVDGQLVTRLYGPSVTLHDLFGPAISLS